MGCCNSRTEAPFKFETITLDTENISHNGIIREEKTTSKLKPQLSLREIIQRPPLGTPEAKDISIISLIKVISDPNDSIMRFLASLSENYEYLAPFGDEPKKPFEFDIIRKIEGEKNRILEFMEKIKGIMRKNYENLAYIFNYEIVDESNFLLKSMASNRKQSQSFSLLLYKEYLEFSLSFLLKQDSIIKPGVLQEAELLSILFGIAKSLKILRNLGIEFDDLNENLFAIDSNGYGQIKMDPSLREFHKKKNLLRTFQGYLAPELNYYIIEENFYVEDIPMKDSNKNQESINSKGNSSILSDNNTKNKRKGSSFSLAVLILRLIFGNEIKINSIIRKEDIFNQYQEILTIKYPKLWYFLEKLLEEYPENRLSLEELLSKSPIINANSELFSFFTLIPKIGKEVNNVLNFDNFEEILTISQGHSIIFQNNEALKLLKQLKFNLINGNLFLFDEKLVLIAEKTGDLLIKAAKYSEALEEYDYLGKSLVFAKEPTALYSRTRILKALCYKYLKKMNKSKEIFNEISNDLNENITNRIKSLNEIAEIYMEEKNVILAKKSLKLAEDLFLIFIGNSKQNQNRYNNTSLNEKNEELQEENQLNSLENSNICNPQSSEKKSTENQLILIENNNNNTLFSETKNNEDFFNSNLSITNKKSSLKEKSRYIANNELISLIADCYELYAKIAMLFEDDFVESLSFMKKSHKIRKNLYSSEHSIIIKSYKLLSICLLNVGDFKEALSAINKNISLIKTKESIVCNPEEVDILRKSQAESLKILSKIQLELMEIDKAEITYKEVLQIYEEISGFYSPSLIKELQGLAGFYSSINAYNKALETYKIAMEVVINVYGDKSIELADNWMLMGEFYEDNGKFSDAIDAFLEGLKGRLEIYGGMNENMIDLLSKISRNYELLGLYSKAAEYGEKVLVFLREKLRILVVEEERKNIEILDKNGENSSKSNDSIVLLNEGDKILMNNGKKDFKAMMIESLFRLGSLYRKMGLNSKGRNYFNEEKKLSSII